MKHCVASQSRIDELMFEYCPDEMSLEQKAEWARHQIPVSPLIEAEVEAALRQSVETPTGE